MDTTVVVSVGEITAELDAPYSGRLPERALRAAQETAGGVHAAAD